MKDWQPIKTAPKDRPILVFEDPNVTTAEWRDGEWVLVVCGAYADDDRVDPTHWMTLPDPPDLTKNEKLR